MKTTLQTHLMVPKAAQWIFYSILLIFLTSCDRLSLIYTWSENYLAYELDHYLDLSGAQEKKIKSEFKGSLDRFLIAHENEIFGYIEDYKKMIADESYDQLPQFSDRSRVWLRTFAADLLPVSQQIGSELTDVQIQRLETQLAKKQAKDAKKNEAKQIVKRLERWMGLIGLDPNSEQEKTIEEFAELKLFPWDLQRLHTKAQLAEFVKIHKNEDQRKTFIQQLFLKTESLRSPEYNKAFDDFFAKQSSLQRSLLQSMTEKQKSAVLRRLDGRKNEVRRLIEKIKSK